MSAELFTDAMSQISDKYITEALNYHCAAKRRPTIHRIGRSIAVACLAVVLCFGTVMAVSAEARAAVFGWVRQQYENFYEYFFEGEAATTEPSKYEPGWMPDSCELITVQETAGGETFIYKDQSGLLVQFYYIFEPDSQKMYIDTVDYVSEPVSVNGHAGEVYMSVNDGDTNSIVWTDKSNNVLFYFSGPFDEDTLIKMAESVKEKMTED